MAAVLECAELCFECHLCLWHAFDNAIHQKNPYLVDSTLHLTNAFPLESDLQIMPFSLAKHQQS